MKQLLRYAIILGLLLALPALQSTAPVAVAQGDIILRAEKADASAFPAVQVDVTIRDQYGVPVGLDKAEFTVSEDHSLQPRPITAVTTTVNADLPITVVIVLDISGSMKGQPLTDAKTAALRFLDRLGVGDKAALIAFADSLDLDGVDPAREQPFTGDIKTLYALVENLKPGDGTPLYDAAYKAVRWAGEQPAGSRVVLLLSDGREEKSEDGTGGSRTANEDSAVRQANLANVPVFTIGLGRRIDEPYLRRLATETGGQYQAAPDSAALVSLFQNVADLLKQQVRITYQSGTPADGQQHTVRVEVRAHERLASGETTFQSPLEGTAQPAAPTPRPAVTAAPTQAPPPAATQPPAPTAGGTGEQQPSGSSSPLLWIAGLGGAGLLLALGGVAVQRWQRSKAAAAAVTHCLRCGQDLPSPDAPCPSCGYQGSFRTPERK